MNNMNRMRIQVVRLLVLLPLLVMAMNATAQDVYSRFYEALQGGDSAATATLMGEIRATGGQGAERYVAEYNYYIHRAMRYSGMMTSTVYPSEDGDELVDGEVYTLTDSTGAEAGYMYFATWWDYTLADSALATIDQGIALHRDRLDMRYGKTHLLRMLRRWDDFAACVHATLDRTAQNRCGWVFPDVDEVPMDTVIIKGVLDYERSLFEALQNSPDSATAMHRNALLRGIAGHMLRLYPKDVYSLNFMAVTYQIEGDRQNALKWLLQAEKASPKDALVLTNIADTYHNLGNTKKERKYLKKIIALGDEEFSERARQYLDELDNKQ